MASVQLLLLQRRIQVLKENSVGKSAAVKKLFDNLVGLAEDDVEDFHITQERERVKKLAMEEERQKAEEGGREKADRISGLSEELLKVIVGKLEEPKDMLSCWRSSGAFQKVLEPTKRVWMFHEVFPHLIHHLGQRDIMKCRKVCRGWKDQIDGFIENVPFPDIASSNWTYKEKIEQVWLKDKFHKTRMFFGETKKINMFLEQMRDKKDNVVHENPFPGRRVCFQLLDDEDRDDDSDSDEDDLGDLDEDEVAEVYWASVMKLLDKFGKHVWECELVLGEPVDSTQFVKVVRDCLLRIPNVRRFSVVASDPYYSMRAQKMSTELQKDLTAKPFPDLPHLVGFSVMDVPSSFVKSIVPKYWKQLETLNIGDFDYNMVLLDSSARNLRDNLKNLNCLHLLVNGHVDLVELESSLLGVPLKSFSISISVQSDWIDYTRILAFVQNLGSGYSLQHVRIDYCNEDDFIDPHVVSKPARILNFALNLYLPSVTMFEMSGSYDSMNYLLCFPNLEYIALSWKQCDEERRMCGKVRKGDILNVYGYLDRMYSSNIWTYLLSLKKFKYQLKEEDDEDDSEEEELEGKVIYERIYFREIYDKKRTA